MMNCCLRCLLISLSVLVLASCSGKTRPADPPPYLIQAQALEVQAARAYRLGNYQQALRLYDRAYVAYSAIDHQAEMAQQNVHRAQIALLLKDDATTQQVLGELLPLLRSDRVSSELKDRYYLLKANQSMQKNQWRSAEDWLNEIDQSNTSLITVIAVNRAILAYQLDRQTSAAEVLIDRELQPLGRARLERLLAEISADSGKLDRAVLHIDAAKHLYREENFTPGIAESLWLEGKVLDQKGQIEQASHARSRATEIFKRLGIPIPDHQRTD